MHILYQSDAFHHQKEQFQNYTTKSGYIPRSDNTAHNMINYFGNSQREREIERKKERDRERKKDISKLLSVHFSLVEALQALIDRKNRSQNRSRNQNEAITTKNKQTEIKK